MPRARGWILAAAAAFVSAGAAQAATVTVDDDFDSGTAGWGVSAFSSIQAAVNYLDGVNPAGDPNGYHTINVAAGTYNAGAEESYQLHTALGNGRGSSAAKLSKSLLVINDVDEDLDGDGAMNGYLNGLHVSGAGVSQTVLQGSKSETNGRLVYIGNSSVVLEGMTLSTAKLDGSWSGRAGSGIMSASQGLVLRNVQVLDVVGNGYGDDKPGTVVNLTNSPHLVQQVEVANCDASVGHALTVVGTSTSRVLLDRVNVHDVATMQKYNYSALYAEYATIVSSVVANAGYAGIHTGHETYLVASTVTGIQNQALLKAGHWGNFYALGSIVADNRTALAESGDGAIFFMHNVIDQTGFAFVAGQLVDGFGGAGQGGTNLQPSTDPGFVQPGPLFADEATGGQNTTRIQVASNAIYSVGDYVEVNMDGIARRITALGDTGGAYPKPLIYIADDPLPASSAIGDRIRNWGSISTIPTIDYSLLAASAGIDLIPLDGTGNDAFVRTDPTNGFVYVDVNFNGSYTQSLDVIIKLNGWTGATDDDWVSQYDLAGNLRLIGSGLDAGAFEYVVPEPATLAFLALGGLAALGARARRRRRA